MAQIQSEHFSIQPEALAASISLKGFREGKKILDELWSDPSTDPIKRKMVLGKYLELHFDLNMVVRPLVTFPAFLVQLDELSNEVGDFLQKNMKNMKDPLLVRCFS